MTVINKRLLNPSHIIYIKVPFVGQWKIVLKNIKVTQVLQIIRFAVTLPGETACGNLPQSSPEILP